MKRRDFIAGSIAGGVLAACGPASRPPLPPGSLTGPNEALAHRLRQRDFPAPTETRKTSVLVMGGGIGGLSAAWKLTRSGMDDYLLLDLEAEPGGNSRSGRTAVSAHPLGAHYLPLPPLEASATRELLAELGVLRGDPRASHPDYDERYVCFAPQERLWIDGYWQEGLWPTLGVPRAERDQYKRFQEQLGRFRERRDAMGRHAFALPMANSIQAPELLALDRISFETWLKQEGYTAPGLYWMADYACRDDFGTRASQTSAWAGLHYFVCRETDSHGGGQILTAPEGNGWLARGLARASAPRTVTNALAWRVEEHRNEVVCDVYLAAENRSQRIIARELIWAAPLFLIPHLMTSPPDAWRRALAGTSYAPWVVANLTLTDTPHTRAGSPLAWDNVFYDSPSLGYVVATHQAMRYTPGPSVITWYRALHEDATQDTAARRLLQQKTREAWAEEVLADIGRPHPEIRELTTRIDVHRHAHAMIRPTPGRLWGGTRAPFERGSPRIRFAHADVSGFSLFEEANYRGVKAAQDTLTRLGVSYVRSV